MNLTLAESLARHLMAAHHLHHWIFGFNRRKRVLGLCRYTLSRIELSRYFVAANDEPAVRDTILHEIAHALAGHSAHHGPRWQSVAARIGAAPERLDHTSIMPIGQWQAHCPTCGKHFWRHRRPTRNRNYACLKCGPENGAFKFTLAQYESAAAP